jgi:hypothetical protein
MDVIETPTSEHVGPFITTVPGAHPGETHSQGDRSLSPPRQVADAALFMLTLFGNVTIRTW